MAEEPSERSVKDLVKCLENQLKFDPKAKPKVPPKPNAVGSSATRTLNEVVSVSSAILYFVVCTMVQPRYKVYKIGKDIRICKQ